MKNLYMLLLALLPVSLFAQNAILSTDTTKVPEIELGEVIINGSKSDIKLKDLPSSVSLMTQRTLKDDEIQSLTDITSIAPNLFMPDYGSKLTTPIYIRGIGSKINAPGVALYVDDVPYFEKASFKFDFFDIDRVEVLRGSQGTLYGRNTIGGVINVKTISPFDFQGVKARLGYGDFGQYESSVGVYQKLNEKFAFSVAAMYKHYDGFYENEYTDKPVDEADIASARLKLIWEPVSDLTATLISSVEYSEEGGYPYAIYDSIEEEPLDINNNQYSSYTRTMASNALVLKYDKKNYQIKMTTSHQMLDDNQSIDQDFSPDSLYFVVQEQVQQMVSNEIIARSKNNKMYNWLFGAFNFQQRFDRSVDVDIYGPNMVSMKAYDHTITGNALFHESRLTLGNLTITGGLRLDYEKDEYDYNYDLKMGSNLIDQPDTIHSRDYSEFLTKIAANYRFNGTNIYGLVSQGYKPGGYNSSWDADHPKHMTFDNEKSINYEVGVKTSLLNKQLYADFAVYFIDWKDQQITKTNPSGIGTHLENAGRSFNKGVELTLKTIPFCGYVTTISYGYTHAQFKSYVENEETNYNGNFLPYAPQHTVSVRFSKSYQLQNTDVLDRIRVSVLYTGNGKTYWDLDNEMSQKYYGLFNAKVSFIKDKFALNFYRKNVFNTQYVTYAYQAFGNPYVQLGRPSYFGASLTYNF
jgi:outer membrane receptor protein involved in Fe transport